MSPRAPELPEQVLQFAPKEKPPRNDGDALDQAGQAIVALLQHAAKVSNEACDRAMGAADKLSIQLREADDRCGRAVGAAEKLSIKLRDAEDRCDSAVGAAQRLSNELHGAKDHIKQLQAELEQSRDRATRADDWLRRIYHEIEEKFMSQRAGSQRGSRQ